MPGDEEGALAPNKHFIRAYLRRSLSRCNFMLINWVIKFYIVTCIKLIVAERDEVVARNERVALRFSNLISRIACASFAKSFHTRVIALGLLVSLIRSCAKCTLSGAE